MTATAATSFRLWTLRLVTFVLVPALLLALLELGLRAFAPGDPTTLLEETNIDGVAMFRENRKFARQFFPAEIAREPLPMAFPKRKSEQTFRIFVLGASAAQGDPEPSYGFSRILERMLSGRHPDLDFEVINTAVTAINSHAVYRIAKEVAPLGGDLFIIYLGNNEVVGPYGAGTIFAPLSRSLSGIRWSIRLKSSSLVQQLSRALRRLRRHPQDPTEWRGMEMFLERQVAAADPALEVVYGHFRANLEDILDVLHRTSAPVILSTVATNLRDSPPFASRHRPSLSESERSRWDELYRLGTSFRSDSRYAAAIAPFLEAEAIDGDYADLQFQLGVCYEELGDEAEAARRYRLARDLDTLRFRADDRIDETIREVASDRGAEGVVLVDGAGAIEAASPGGIPGNELFHDHVHLDFEGNFRLASALLRVVETLLPEPDGKSVGAVDPPLTLDEAERLLAFTGFDRHRIADEMARRLARPPFTNQLDHANRIEQARRRERELRKFTTSPSLDEAARRYEQALSENPGDPWLHYNFGILLYAAGRFEAAAAQFEATLAALPHHRVARERTIASLAHLGRTDEVVVRSREALRIDPEFDAARYSLASALARLGRSDESLAIYRDLLRRDPTHAIDILSEIGLLQVRRGEFAKAVEAFAEGVRLSRRSSAGVRPDLLYNLGVALQRGGHEDEAGTVFSEAVSAYRKRIDADGASARMYFELGSVYVELREFADATDAFRAALELDPTDIDACTYLALSLQAQGRLNEAVGVLKAGATRMQQSNRPEEARDLLRRSEALEARVRQPNAR